MSGILDDEKREYERYRRWKTYKEHIKSTPYDLSSSTGESYVGHIKKWKPLIERNDPSIYSNWKTYSHQWWSPEPDDVRKIGSLLDNTLLSYSDYPFVRNDNDQSRRLDFSKVQLDDRDSRLSMIRFVFDSYEFMNENKSGPYVWKGKSIDDGHILKKDVVKTIERLTNQGYNPFDIVYYTTTKQYRRRESYVLLITLTLIMVWIGSMVVGSVQYDWGSGITFILILLLIITYWGLLRSLPS